MVDEGGVDPPGKDGGDPHAEGGELLPSYVPETGEGELGGGVGRVGRDALLAVQGAHHDDMPLPALH